jgi:ribosome-binding factor A
MKHHRLERVAEVIRETASETVLYKLHDPRVKGVTVTRAEVAADLQHAKVFVSIMGSEQEQHNCLAGLQSAAGYVQRQIGDRLRLRYTPALAFVLDKGVKNSLEIARILKAEAELTPPADTGPREALANDEAGADSPPSS